MKKCICFMTAVAMIFALLTTSVQAAGEESLVRVKGEDFTGTVISGTAITGTNGLAATKVNPQRTTGEVVSEGLGGKPSTDKYLRVNRNSETDSTGGYYFGIVLPGEGNQYTEGNPVTVSFSAYAPENLGSSPFFCQIGPMNNPTISSPSPIGAVYFVTDENAVVNNNGSLQTQRFLVNAGEWNRISITMYPMTSNTVVTVNGKSYTYSVINASKKYDQYLRSLRMQLPMREGKTDEFMAYDDFVIYAGAGAEPYTAPANALTAVGGTALVGEDTVYITGEFNESDFSVEGGELCVIKDENEKAVKLAVWVKGNPVPKYYDIRTVEGNDLVAVSLTADADNHAFVAKGFANGDAGTVIAAAYSKEDNQLLHVTVQNIANEYEGYGSFVKSIPIADYDSEKIYKAFWWSSMETMNPLLRCNFENASERN